MPDENTTAPSPESAGGSPRANRLSPDKLGAYIVVGLLALGVVGYFGGRVVWQKIRTQHAREQARQAEKFALTKNYPDALRAIRTAIKMAPNDPAVLRATANWCTLIGSPDGLVYWDRLAELEPLSRQDSLQKLDLALSLHRLDISRELLKTLLKSDPKDREIMIRAVKHHALTGQLDNAIKVARIAVVTLPTDLQLQFLLGGLLLESSAPEGQEEARRVLWSVALENSAWQAPAVDLLGQKRILNDGDRLLLIHSIEARVAVSLDDRLRILNLRLPMTSNPERIWSQTDDLQTRYPGVTNQVRIARWLAAAGATNRSVAMLPMEAATTNHWVAKAALEVLTRARNWDGTRALLEKKPSPLPVSVQEAARGLMAAANGTLADAAGYFSNAVQKAGGHADELIQVATYAETAKLPAVAANALLQAADLNPILIVESCRRALALTQSMEDLTLARRTMEKLAQYLPGEPSILLERSWLDLLFKEKPDRASQTLSLITNHPTVGPEARVFLALAELRKGENAAALSRLETLGLEATKLSPRSQAVYAMVLLANNQREPARRLAAQIVTDKMHKKELELIAPLR